MARTRVASKGALEVEGDYIGARFEFVNGVSKVVRISDLPETIVGRLIVHGLLQKVGDSYSGISDVGQAVEAADSVITALIAGNWSTRGEGLGGMLLEALIEYFTGQGRTEEEVRERFREMSKEERDGLRKHPKIKVIMTRLAAERAEAAAEDADDLEL